MARFYKTEGGFAYDSGDGVDMALTEDNLMLHLHRKAPYMDRVSVEDPRDERWWNWTRCDMEPEQFEGLHSIALQIGSILIRDTPMEHIQETFDNQHRFNDTDYDQLLGGSNA